jgi:hypothetical protein
MRNGIMSSDSQRCVLSSMMFVTLYIRFFLDGLAQWSRAAFLQLLITTCLYEGACF